MPKLKEGDRQRHGESLEKIARWIEIKFDCDRQVAFSHAGRLEKVFRNRGEILEPDEWSLYLHENFKNLRSLNHLIRYTSYLQRPEALSQIRTMAGYLRNKVARSRHEHILLGSILINAQRAAEAHL